VEPLNVSVNASHSQYDHTMSVYVLLKSAKIICYKTEQSVLLYVVNLLAPELFF